MTIYNINNDYVNHNATYATPVQHSTETYDMGLLNVQYEVRNVPTWLQGFGVVVLAAMGFILTMSAVDKHIAETNAAASECRGLIEYTIENEPTLASLTLFQNCMYDVYSGY